jgi:hypothetical protein
MINNKNDNLQQVALFRFSLIAPLVNNCHTFKSQTAFFKSISSKSHTLPSGKQITIATNTLKKWFIDYSKNGFDSLIPKTRCDFGCSRSIPVDVLNRVNTLRDTLPHITGKAIYKKLIEEGVINSKDVSISSLYRLLNSNHLKSLPSVERKAFEMEYANDCWQCDTSHRSYYHYR